MQTKNNHQSYDEAREKKYSKRDDIDFLSLPEFNSHPILVYCREAKT